MFRSVELGTMPDEIEAVMTSDRIVEIDETGHCVLADIQFVVTDDQIIRQVYP